MSSTIILPSDNTASQPPLPQLGGECVTGEPACGAVVDFSGVRCGQPPESGAACDDVLAFADCLADGVEGEQVIYTGSDQICTDQGQQIAVCRGAFFVPCPNAAPIDFPPPPAQCMEIGLLRDVLDNGADPGFLLEQPEQNRHDHAKNNDGKTKYGEGDVADRYIAG